MLQKFVNICERNNLTYYLGDGTLLGAIRHKGFIPWDDDIDVLMPYADYKKFLDIGQKQLGEDYFLQTSKSDKNWYRVYATIRKVGTSMIQNPQYHVNQGIWLDIFIIGNARTKFECKLQRKMIMILNYFLMDHYMKINKREFKSILTPIGYAFFRVFYRVPWNLRYKIRQVLLNWVCNEKQGKYCPEIWCAITDVYERECFEGKPELVEFEGSHYKAPHNVELYLKTQYGTNFMTPIKWERGHEKIILDLHNSYLKYIK